MADAIASRRILFVGETWPGSTGAGLVRGLRGLGHTVLCLDSSPILLPYSGRTAQRILGRVFAGSNARKLGHAIVAMALAERVDIMMTVKGRYIGADTLNVLRGHKVLTVNYWPDVSLVQRGTTEAALRAYGHIVSSKRYHLETLEALMGKGRASFVHHGYVEGVHAPRPCDFEHDISYVGNPSPYKVEWVRAIAQALPEHRLTVAGNHWQRAMRGQPPANVCLAPPVMNDDFAAFVSASRINLAFHYGPVAGCPWEDSVSTRTFEIPACAGLMLHIANPEVAGLYDVGREIAVFSTASEAADTARELLANEPKRAAIAKAGHARCVPAYGYDRRAAELMAVIAPQLPAPA